MRKPVFDPNSPARRICPGCGKVSYSPNGEHPQCAMARADAADRVARKERDAAALQLAAAMADADSLGKFAALPPDATP